jgi:hypothetical protein
MSRAQLAPATMITFCAPLARTSPISSFMPADCQFAVMVNGEPPVSYWLRVQPFIRQVNWSGPPAAIQ